MGKYTYDDWSTIPGGCSQYICISRKDRNDPLHSEIEPILNLTKPAGYPESGWSTMDTPYNHAMQKQLTMKDLLYPCAKADLKRLTMRQAKESNSYTLKHTDMYTMMDVVLCI